MNHNMEGTPTWMSWRSMVHRCFRKKDSAYRYYGAAGIKVCDFIRKSPINLISVIGLRPIGKTADRINTKLHYSCGECEHCKKESWSLNIRWATPKEQARNRNKPCKKILYNGEMMFIGDVEKITGIHRNTITRRIKSGIKIDRESPKSIIEINGVKRRLSEWASMCGLSRQTIQSRISYGMKGEELIHPPHGRNGKKIPEGLQEFKTHL